MITGAGDPAIVLSRKTGNPRSSVPLRQMNSTIAAAAVSGPIIQSSRRTRIRLSKPGTARLTASSAKAPLIDATARRHDSHWARWRTALAFASGSLRVPSARPAIVSSSRQDDVGVALPRLESRTLRKRSRRSRSVMSAETWNGSTARECSQRALPCFLQPAPHHGQGPIHAIIHSLRIRPTEHFRDRIGRHLLHYKKLDSHAFLCTEKGQSRFQLFTPLMSYSAVVLLRVDFGRRLAQLAENPSAPSPGDRPIRAADLSEELPEREIQSVNTPHQLVGFNVTALVQEHMLEDPAPERRQSPGNRRESAAAIAVAKPIDSNVTNNRDQPGGEAGPMLRLLDPGPQPPQIVRAQRLTRAREHIHHIVIVLGVMPDCCEDQTPVSIEEQVPRGVGPAPLQLGHPVVHSRP